MVSLEQLQALDVYQWLGSGGLAARVLQCHQSTISRQCLAVTRTFGLRAAARRRSAQGAGWGVELLALERQVHQCSRFGRRRMLRLHSYRWSSGYSQAIAAAGWITPPPEADATRPDPLALLTDRVVDAALLPGPACPDPADRRFRVLPLYTTPLQLLVPASSGLHRERGLSASDVARAACLGRLPFVPVLARRCSQQLDGALFGAAPAATDRPGAVTPTVRCYGNALTRLLLPELRPLDLDLGVTYREVVVVLEEHGDAAAVQDLLQALQRGLLHLWDRQHVAVDLSG